MPNTEAVIFDSSLSFEEKALTIFNYQIQHLKPYRLFVESLYGVDYEPRKLSEIPLVPIELFREVPVISDEFDQPEIRFRSSGTSSMKRSEHYVAKKKIYEKSISCGFDDTYGLPNPIILAFTPGYNDNPESSLIFMLDYLIQNDSTGLSKFLDVQNPPTTEELHRLVRDHNRPLLLFGAAFGLLDWIENHNIELPDETIVIETGGMKTHRREMTKNELRTRLSEGFNIRPEKIHSEYGMTEMLSQAYSAGDEWFIPAPTLKVSIRDHENPDREVPFKQEGVIGIYDLSNIYSCSFFQTADLGIAREDGAFKVLGRATGGMLRGCNFLLEDE